MLFLTEVVANNTLNPGLRLGVLLAGLILAYICGSVNGAIVCSFAFYRKDIRNFGSGNAGLTNYYRVFGKKTVLFVFLIDALKTAVPVVLCGYLFKFISFPGFAGFTKETGTIGAGLFCMLGHAYPVFYKFRGGKTVMALGTLVWFVSWKMAICCWIIFILAVLLSRYVSLGSIVGAAAYPIFLMVFAEGSAFDWCVAGISALFLIVRHRANIVRILKKTESKLTLHRS
ncbi:MAG: glycerol-3-phosphate 1-O-acyltransferase PlsY [Oscillospiraceae bacterium]|jgi:glycerol-3-phosphate acyltransferase PlsY|nr:glycerol-3-phosphate 1-O-acyltransferase PlsY [Oscillospiraceae bacterium]